MQIVYFSPNPAQASGGVKVIYRHAALIDGLGLADVSARVYHFEKPGGESPWYEGPIHQKVDGQFVASRDLVVLPECHLRDFWARFAAEGIRYAVFVQNAYLIGIGLDRQQVRAAFSHAELILVISDDSASYVNWLFPELASRIIPVRWSIAADLFQPAPQKSRVITFMPRRMADHARRVIDLLAARLPASWHIRALDGMTERQVAQALGQSSIFMAFSGQEGLPLPPVEAAMAGNRVVGYHGQGGREYWDTALFREIECGNLMGFARAVLEEVSACEGRLAAGLPLEDESRRVARGLLGQRFSAERERELLFAFVRRVQACMPASTPKAL